MVGAWQLGPWSRHGEDCYPEKTGFQTQCTDHCMDLRPAQGPASPLSSWVQKLYLEGSAFTSEEYLASSPDSVHGVII